MKLNDNKLNAMISSPVMTLIIAATLTTGCSQKVNYPVEGEQSQQSSQHESTHVRDATAPSFITKALSSDLTPARQAFIETYNIKASISGLFVQIETELTVRNPDNHPVAGTIEMPLPDGAVINGYAIDITNEEIKHQMVDAVVIYTRRIRDRNPQPYDEPDITKPNLFKTDIDMIYPYGYRQIRITYTMPLKIESDGTGSVLLPMRKNLLLSRTINISVNIPDIDKPKLSENVGTDFVKIDNVYSLEHTDNHIAPEKDIRLSIPGVSHDQFHITKYIERDQKYPEDRFVMLDADFGKSIPAPNDLSKIRIIWDASGSRTTQDIQKAIEIIERLPEDVITELHVFRNTPDIPRTFNTRNELIRYLENIPYDGGTNYEPLKDIAESEFDGMTLFFSDGLDTFKQSLPDFGNHSIALLSGKNYNKISLREICRGHIVDLNTVSPDDALKKILLSKITVYKITSKHLSNIQWIEDISSNHMTLVGKWDGISDTITLYLSDGTQKTMQISGGDEFHTGRTIATTWAIDRVRDLSGNSYENHTELEEIGKKYSINSPVTFMVVFTQSEQWIRHEIEPPKDLVTVYHEYQEASKLFNRYHASKIIVDKSEQIDSTNLVIAWNKVYNWWFSPIPQNITKSYHCPNNDMSQCTVKVSSEFGTHYTSSFKPPKAWKCDKTTHCSQSARNLIPVRPEPKDYSPPPWKYFSENTNNMIVVGKSDRHENTLANTPDWLQERFELKDWDRKTPYLKSLSSLLKSGATADELYTEYLNWKPKYTNSTAFYFEVADFFFKEKMNSYAKRILTNLFEPGLKQYSLNIGWRYEPHYATLGRSYLRRLINAGELEEAAFVADILYSYDDGVEWLFSLAKVLDMYAR